MAPRYDGFSRTTVSPGSMKIFPIKSRPCCEPLTIRISDGSKIVCRRWESRSATQLRISGMPSVTPYCRAAAPYSSMTSAVHSAISRVGKSSGAGSPPPNEITSGCCVTFSISRMVEARSRDVRSANRAAVRCRWVVIAPSVLADGHGRSANARVGGRCAGTGARRRRNERQNRCAQTNQPHEHGHDHADDRNQLSGRNERQTEHERHQGRWRRARRQQFVKTTSDQECERCGTDEQAGCQQYRLNEN